MLQPMSVFLRVLLTALSSDSPSLGNVWVGLYTALNAALGPNLAMSNVTEASFDGYARQHISAWTGPYQNSAGRQALIDAAMHWTPSDDSFPQTIVGAFLSDSSVAGAGTLKALDSFAATIALTGPTTTLSYVPEFDLDPRANYGGGTVIS